MKTKFIIIVILLIILLFALKYCTDSPPPSRPLPPSPITKVEVNCKTESLAAIVKANPKAKEFILSEGECEIQSPIVITQDNVTYSGEGKTKTFVKPAPSFINTMPVFKIVGARGVTLKGLTVQGGKQGILVIPRNKKGADLVLDNVLVENSSDVNLCVIGIDEKAKIKSKNNQANLVYENCPRPSPRVEKSKSVSSVISSETVDLFALEASANINRQVCQENRDPNEWCRIIDGESVCEDTNVNICNSDFSNSVSGIVSYYSTIYSCQSNGARCISKIKDNEISALYIEDSTLKLVNSHLIIQRNGVEGLSTFQSDIILEESSKIESNSNGDGENDDVLIYDSSANCQAGSFINTDRPITEGSVYNCMSE